MAKLKYEKYFLRGPKPKEQQKWNVERDVVAFVDGDVIEGSFHFAFVHQFPSNLPPVHGPHTHPTAEVIGIFGTNPDEPLDLGAEIDIYMGEEMEKHSFNQSTLIYIPPGFAHCPIIYKRVDRPHIFCYSMPLTKVHETPRKDLLPLLPDSIRAKVIFPYEK
jgi:hypothetical protein